MRTRPRDPVSTSATHRISVCWRFAAATDSSSLVFQGNQTWALVNGTPIWKLPTSKNQDRPVPLKIARYVCSVSPTLPVVASTTMPLIRNASSTVSSGATSPPAFWSTQ